jgi:hypothetical protein
MPEPLRPTHQPLSPKSTIFPSLRAQGDFVIYGNYFRLLSAPMVNCIWLYDAYYPAEYVQDLLGSYIELIGERRLN